MRSIYQMCMLMICYILSLVVYCHVHCISVVPHVVHTVWLVIFVVFKFSWGSNVVIFNDLIFVGHILNLKGILLNVYLHASYGRHGAKYVHVYLYLSTCEYTFSNACTLHIVSISWLQLVYYSCTQVPNVSNITSLNTFTYIHIWQYLTILKYTFDFSYSTCTCVWQSFKVLVYYLSTFKWTGSMTVL